MTPAFVINLAQATARRERILAEFAAQPEFSLTFVAGVDGGMLSLQALAKLSNLSAATHSGHARLLSFTCESLGVGGAA
jgi:GR25 family glycosyltransferase involved in LPS biosynthesis